MPAITRQGDTCTGHDDCPPSSLVGCESNVLIDGKPVGVVGSTYAPHGCDVHDPHSDVIASGSSTVFVNGKPVGRVGDAVSIGGSVASGSPTVTVDSLGPDDIVNFVKCTNNYIDNVNNLSEVDEVIFYTPQIARHEALKDTLLEKDQKGWLELSKMLAKWLANNKYTFNVSDIKNKKAPIFILSMDWEWFMLYEEFKIAYKKLLENLFATDKKLLAFKETLKKIGVWDSGGYYNMVSKDYYKREDYYYDFIEVEKDTSIDGMGACLANHTIRVLSEGSVEVDKQTGLRRITINKTFTYVDDRFQFEGYDTLLSWSKAELDFSPLPLNTSYKVLFNSDFREFRDRYNIGQDFWVLSKIHYCKEIEPIVIELS